MRRLESSDQFLHAMEANPGVDIKTDPGRPCYIGEKYSLSNFAAFAVEYSFPLSADETIRRKQIGNMLLQITPN